MRVFQNKTFKKWASNEGLSDFELLDVIAEMEMGLTGDSLGGGIYKKRLRLEGRGKSGGARTIIAYKTESRAFFLVGYSKNERANISLLEEKVLKMLAHELFGYTNEEIEAAVKANELFEIKRYH